MQILKNKYRVALMSDYFQESIELHKKYKGKISIEPKVPLKNKEDLSKAYSPGVAAVCQEIQKGANAKEFTTAKNTVAVVTDGSAVLGLGNIGPQASLPVMEGKAALFKAFAGVDAFPIALDTQDTEEIIKIVKAIAPTFGGINLEDISAPRCFEIEKRLTQELDIPVFHDDQHGTAIVVLAGLINALKIVKKKKEDLKIVINGSGAAGVAIAKLLTDAGFPKSYITDSGGLVSECRDDLNEAQKELLACCSISSICGGLNEVIDGADVFIGVSVGNVLTKEQVKRMADNPIVFALANPIPEIDPQDAKEAGAFIVATGRSDYPNQINNVLVFPGIFKGALNSGAKKITTEMKLKAAEALASLVESPTPDKIIPDPFNRQAPDAVASAVEEVAKTKE